MHALLKNLTYIGKKLLFNFLGADVLSPKSSHRLEKQLALGSAHGFTTSFLGATRNSIYLQRYVIRM